MYWATKAAILPDIELRVRLLNVGPVLRVPGGDYKLACLLLQFEKRAQLLISVNDEPLSVAMRVGGEDGLPA